MDRMVVGEDDDCWAWSVSNLRPGRVRQEVGALARALCESRLELEAHRMMVRLRSCLTPASALNVPIVHSRCIRQCSCIPMHKNATYQSECSSVLAICAASWWPVSERGAIER